MGEEYTLRFGYDYVAGFCLCCDTNPDPSKTDWF